MRDPLQRQSFTPYDAASVALAELLDAVLVTGDRRLSGSLGRPALPNVGHWIVVTPRHI
jgi:predicted nucleic acid-binding protein